MNKTSSICDINDVSFNVNAISAVCLEENSVYADPFDWPVAASVKMITLSTYPQRLKCLVISSFVTAK